MLQNVTVWESAHCHTGTRYWKTLQVISDIFQTLFVDNRTVAVQGSVGKVRLRSFAKNSGQRNFSKRFDEIGAEVFGRTV